MVSDKVPSGNLSTKQLAKNIQITTLPSFSPRGKGATIF